MIREFVCFSWKRTSLKNLAIFSFIIAKMVNSHKKSSPREKKWTEEKSMSMNAKCIQHTAFIWMMCKYEFLRMSFAFVFSYVHLVYNEFWCTRHYLCSINMFTCYTPKYRIARVCTSICKFGPFTESERGEYM